ncbi:MAG: hypothetical protein QXR73_03660 [Candidatus Micrarchaeaceae archaeon]
MKISMLAAIFLLLTVLAPSVGAVGTEAGTAGQNGLQSYLSLHPALVAQIKVVPAMLTSITPPVVSMGLAIIIVLVVIAISAFIYIIAGVINSFNAKNWAKIQIYEALLSIVLLLIFLGLFYLFLINPSTYYNSVGLLPKECNTPSINTLFNLSACDIGTFSNNALGYFDLVSVIGLATGSSPGLEFGFNLIEGFGVSAELTSIMPDGIEGMLGTGLSALVFFLVLNNLQLILISGSILFLIFFITLGVFARLFGITRTFGGAMIAFGLGLGVIYPLLISLTYGFIDANMISATGALALLPPAIADFITFAYASAIPLLPSGLILGLGYVIAGLTFIPFINFIILDAFIVDFSRAIGEKVSFMALLSNFI